MKRTENKNFEKIMRESLSHNVKVITENGKTYEGLVDFFVYEDEEDGNGSCSFAISNEHDGSHWGLFESDIKSIEILD